MSAGKEHECLTPTDALVIGLETAEEMEDVIIIYRLKNAGKHGAKGYGWIAMKNRDYVQTLGLLAAAQQGIYNTSFEDTEDK